MAHAHAKSPLYRSEAKNPTYDRLLIITIPTPRTVLGARDKKIYIYTNASLALLPSLIQFLPSLDSKPFLGNFPYQRTSPETPKFKSQMGFEALVMCQCMLSFLLGTYHDTYWLAKDSPSSPSVAASTYWQAAPQI